MKRLLPLLFMFPLLPLFAGWGDHGVTLVSTESSSVEGAVKYELKDGKGRVFFINAPSEPDKPVMTRILRHHDEFRSWKHVGIKELSFYTYGKGIQAVIVPSSLSYKDTDLKPYLPSGFTFVERGDGIDYRYRIIVNNTSLKLGGAYSGEEPMLDELHAYVHGIRQGTIIVEDEKVVSGSVVAFTSEKEKGARQVHPVGDLPGPETKVEPSSHPVSRADAAAAMLAANAGLLYPLGHFGEMAGPGFGGGISYRKEGMFFKSFGAGLEAGFYYMTGKDSMDQDNQKTDSAIFIPVQAFCGYNFPFTKKFSAGPYLSAGLAYFRMKYTARDRTTYAVTGKSAEDTDPVVNGGISMDYTISESFIVNIRCAFGYLPGAEEGMYLVADAGLKYRL